MTPRKGRTATALAFALLATGVAWARPLRAEAEPSVAELAAVLRDAVAPVGSRCSALEQLAARGPAASAALPEVLDALAEPALESSPWSRSVGSEWATARPS